MMGAYLHIALFWMLAGFLSASGPMRVTSQVIELDPNYLTEWMEEDVKNQEIHQKAMALVKSNDASLIDTSLVTLSSGAQAEIASNLEYIFPTEYESEIPACPPITTESLDKLEKKHIRDRLTPTAYETRNVGVSLDVRAKMESGGEMISVEFSYESVRHLGTVTHMNYTDQYGEAPVRIPMPGV